MNGAIYDPLTTINATNNAVEPALALSWKETTPTTWVFQLRHGVTFSNGEPFTSTAVVDALNYVTQNATGKTSSTGELFAPVVTSTTATGPYTVTIKTRAPDIILPQVLDELYIPAPNALASEGEKGLDTKPVGTGPFEVTSWGETTVDMKAFTKSWRAPKVGFLTATALPTSASRLQALQSGQIDLAVSLDPDQVSQLNSSQEQAVITPVSQVLSLALINTVTSPIKNPLVRQALNYAVNKSALGSDLLLGKGQATGQGDIPGVPGYNPAVKPFAFDPTKAKALLAKAGYPHGFALTADVIVGYFPSDASVYEAMAQDFDSVGVKTTLNQIPFSQWLTNFLSSKWGSAHAFGLSWNALFTNDITTSMDDFSCLKTPAFFCDKATAATLRDAEAVNSLTQRNADIEKVAAEMAANPPAVWLSSEIDINAISSKLVGFQDLRRSFPYQSMYLK